MFALRMRWRPCKAPLHSSRCASRQCWDRAVAVLPSSRRFACLAPFGLPSLTPPRRSALRAAIAKVSRESCRSTHRPSWQVQEDGCRLEDIRAAVEACGPDVPGVREFIRGVQAGRDRMKPHVRAQEMTAAAIARGKLGIKGS